MDNRVFNGLETFYTDTSYNADTGMLTVSNDTFTNSFSVRVIPQVDYQYLDNMPEIIVQPNEPTSVLGEDSIHIDTVTNRVWVGVSGSNLKVRDPDNNPLVIDDAFVDLSHDYTGKIVRAKDGNLYKQTVSNPTIEPTDIHVVSTPILDTNSSTFDSISFESLTVDEIYYVDKDSIGIVDIVSNKTYAYVKNDNALAILKPNDTRISVNGAIITVDNNVLRLIGTTYSFPLSPTATVKPYYDSIAILDDTKLLLLEPAGEIVLTADTESLLKPIIDDINISEFMYIDGLLCFMSITQNKYYLIDIIEETIMSNTTSFDIVGKPSVLLDNGYIYFIQDNTSIYGFYALDVQWEKVGIDDILPNQFCNSLKLTDVMTIKNNRIMVVTNANGADLISTITAHNGHIYMVEDNLPSVVHRVAGIDTMKTTTKVTSNSLILSIVAVAVVDNEVLVATVDNRITRLTTDTLAIGTFTDMTSKIDGNIIDISPLGSNVYILTDANRLYVFDNLESNPIAAYVLPIVGGLSKICPFNSSSFALTDIEGTSTGVYEMRIGKQDDVQLSTRIVIENNTYPHIFMYLGKLAVMNGTLNTDVSLYDVTTELRRI